MAYEAGAEGVAYIAPVSVGHTLPDMPRFLTEQLPVPVPLERTDQTTWEALPQELRIAVETGQLPGSGYRLTLGIRGNRLAPKAIGGR